MHYVNVVFVCLKKKAKLEHNGMTVDLSKNVTQVVTVDPQSFNKVQ